MGHFGASPLRNTSLCFFDSTRFPGVKCYVGLSLDDAPCRFGRANSRIAEVHSLLKEHTATATFMVMGKFLSGHEADLAALLRDDNELGNHCMADRPYHQDTSEDFTNAVDACN